jgi:signal transduction histidine kinase
VAVSIAILAAVLVVFGLALTKANGDERRDALQRFEDRAQVTAALTESLFASSAGAQAVELGKEFGTTEVDQRKLDARAREGNISFAVIVDSDRNVVATSSGGDSAGAQEAATDPSVERVLGGAPYSLSDFRPGGAERGTLLYSLPFKSVAGDRVYISVFPAGTLSDFLGAYLARVPGAKETSSYILDSRGQVIGSPVKGQKAGTRVGEAGLVEAVKPAVTEGTFSSGGQERAFEAADVANSTWRVTLTVPTAQLYAGISSTVEWLLLLALALSGVAAVWMLARATKAAATAEAASGRLELANAELGQSNLELQRSNAELEQFASVASHDLQEPLRKVQTFGDQLERRFGESIPDEGLDYLRRMRNAAGRMSVLIDDLLRFSRVTTRALPPEPVDLARIAREATIDLEALLDETHGSVDVGDLPTVEADPVQMRQLMQNLIGNAVKFHRPGEPPRVRVNPSVAPRPGLVAFTVTDNGIGIGPEYRERIFRVFERLHPRDVYAGTGIGLALCRKIVERHGGTITVEAAPDGGSRFVVVLPPAQRGRANGNGVHRAQSESDSVAAHA